LSKIRKGLLQAWSNPKKFKLTDSGLALAEKLLGIHAEALSIHTSQTADNSQTTKSSMAATASSASDVFSDASWLKDVSLGVQHQEQQQAEPNKLNPDTNTRIRTFLYCYVSGSGQESGDQAEADIGFEDSVAYLIKCRKTGKICCYTTNYLFCFLKTKKRTDSF